MKQKDLKKSATKILTDLGSAIRGERVIAQFRTMRRPIVMAGTSTHRIQQSKLEGSVFCVIDKPLSYLSDISKKKR